MAEVSITRPQDGEEVLAESDRLRQTGLDGYAVADFHGAAFEPGIGCAEAIPLDGGGDPPGSTTTRVPTLTRSNRSETSSFSMPMQPDDTNLPMVDGWLVP